MKFDLYCVSLTTIHILGGHSNMKVVTEKVVDESDAFDDSGSDDTPPPVLQKKSIKVRIL